MIVINNLTKKYPGVNKGDEVIALNDISLFLPDKGFIAIYGASGCGKSTLLNILGGLDVADFGTMIVNGRDTTGFKAHDWDSYRNQEVGFIFQNYFLLPHLNVYDNIAVTLQMSKQTKDMKKKIHDALNEVGLAGYSKRFPKQLSGGQQQRVAIARALVTNPSIILADEPTGALDEKSSKSVMKTLKEISQNHLVVMVTHNERMAKEYADRMIEISYGQIVEDNVIQPESDEIICKSPLIKVHLPFRTSMKWSLRNVIKKKGRSIPIAIASAIGLACAGLVLSMTDSVNKYVAKAQEAAIKDYPVYVTCYSKNSSESAKASMIEFPETADIIIEKSDYVTQEHYISMQDDFMNYMNQMPSDYYAHVYSNEAVSFNLFTKPTHSSIQKISSGYTLCIAPTDDTYKFINEQYDVLAGHLPQNDTDLTIVVDTYNRIDLVALQNMGFDTSEDRIKAENIIGKEYKVVDNNSMYTPKEKTIEITKEDGTTEEFTGKQYVRKNSSHYEDLYDGAFHTMKITGIIRPKYESPNPLYQTMLLYHPSFKDMISTKNQASDIVKSQLEYGTNFDVINGVQFVDAYQSNYKVTANYSLEYRLIDIGGKNRTTSIYYYTVTFEQRDKITKYMNSYRMPEGSDIVLRTKDYLEQVTSTFSGLVKTFSTVLFVFSLVAILVSAILTAILTYISVIERKREIGLLRSLGARKRDISNMFIAEASIVGIVAGILGIGLCYALAPALAKIVVGLVDAAGSKILAPSVTEFSHVQPWLVPVMFGGAILIGVVASLIPAIIAGNKKPADSLRE